MQQQYQEHRTAFLGVLSDSILKYRDDVKAGLASGAELMSAFEMALA